MVDKVVSDCLVSEAFAPGVTSDGDAAVDDEGD